MNETNQPQPQTSPIHTNSSMKDSILERIASEQVVPRSRVIFLVVDVTVWVLWIVSIVVGAVALATALYQSMHAGVELYEVTHVTLTAFIIDSLPYVWLGAFLMMLLAAYFQVRRTKHGYRYPYWQVIISSLLFTLVGGWVLYYAGVGMMVDKLLASTMPLYLSAEARQEHMWMHPEIGRLTGVTIKHSDTDVYVFRDSSKQLWSLYGHELPHEDRELLASGIRVRVIGEVLTESDDKSFIACHVMPWLPKAGYTWTELRQNATNSQKRLHMPREELLELREDFATSTKMMVCRDIMRRLLPTTQNN